LLVELNNCHSNDDNAAKQNLPLLFDQQFTISRKEKKQIQIIFSINRVFLLLKQFEKYWTSFSNPNHLNVAVISDQIFENI